MKTLTEIKVAVLTMQKNEKVLFPFFADYYGRMFDYSNIYYFDNGSDDDFNNILKAYEAVGVNVIRDYCSKKDFENKGKILQRYANNLIKRFDVVLFLDADEFLCVSDGSKFCFSPEIILNCFKSHNPGIYEIDKIYRNHPDRSSLYSLHTDRLPKLLSIKTRVFGLDVGFHSIKYPTKISKIKLCYFEYHNRGFKAQKAAALEKMKHRVSVDDKGRYYSRDKRGIHLLNILNTQDIEGYNKYLMSTAWTEGAVDFAMHEDILRSLSENEYIHNNEHLKYSVAIIMPTFNGVKYIGKQIESILNQSHSNLRIYIRDDGSSDGTEELINSFKKLYNEKIVVVKDNMGRLGVVDNINRIFQAASADYYALADQDDVWDTDNLKLKITAAIKVKQCQKLPVIVYSDLKIVDFAGSDLNNSFMKFMKYDKIIKSLQYIPFYNMVPGCTMVFDDDFRKISLPIPKATPMHDFWFSCVAKYLAKHVYVDTPLVLYRQHENNTIGVKVDRLIRKRVISLLFGFSNYVERAASYNHNRRIIIDELLSRANPSCSGIYELTKIRKMFNSNILIRFLFVIRSGLRIEKLGYFLFGK